MTEPLGGHALTGLSGQLTIIKRRPEPQVLEAKRGLWIQDEQGGHYRTGRGRLLYANKDWSPRNPTQKQFIALLEKVWPSGPRALKDLLLGHDLHLSLYGELYVRQTHHQQRDPFSNAWGWTENKGLVSRGLVTTAFRDFLALQLVTDSSAIGDFKFHRPGTDTTTAELNTQTTLTADAGVEGIGTQTNPTASTYQSIATVTATAPGTWGEHQIRNATGPTGGTMLDRSRLTGSPPPVTVAISDDVEFLYLLTCNAE